MHKLSKATPVDFFLIILLGLSWGGAFAAIKVSLEIVSVLHLVALRILLGGLVVFFYLFIKRIPLIVRRGNWFLAFVISILSSVVPFILINWAELYINSSLTSLVFSLGPLISIISNHLLTDDDKINAYKFVGIALGFTGFMLIFTAESLFVDEVQITTILAILAVFLANICYVISGILLRAIKSSTPISLGGNIFLISIMFTLPLLFFTPPKTIMTVIEIQHILAIVYIGFISTGFSYVLRIIVVLRVGQSYMSMAAYLIPPVGMLIGWLLLDEEISHAIIFSLILIVLGMLVARKGQMKGIKP